MGPNSLHPRLTILWGLLVLDPAPIRPPLLPFAALLTGKVVPNFSPLPRDATYVSRVVGFVFHPRDVIMSKEMHIGENSDEFSHKCMKMAMVAIAFGVKSRRWNP